MSDNLPQIYRDALSELNENQLKELNRTIVEKINFFHRARQFKSMIKFNVGDRAFFAHNGGKIFGKIIKLNQRSVTLQCDDGRQWRIAPSLLVKV